MSTDRFLIGLSESQHRPGRPDQVHVKNNMLAFENFQFKFRKWL